jgi:hypothetical protein
VRAADRVCARAQRRSGHLFAGRPQTPQDYVRLGTGLDRIVAGVARDVRGLDLPSGLDRVGARAFVRSVRPVARAARRLRAAARRLQAAVRAGDRTAALRASAEFDRALDALDRADRASTRVARTYGMGACAEDPEDGPRAPPVQGGPVT